jgi:hypothetical protein
LNAGEAAPAEYVIEPQKEREYIEVCPGTCKVARHTYPTFAQENPIALEFDKDNMPVLPLEHYRHAAPTACLPFTV